MSCCFSHAETLAFARQHAEAGRFGDFLALCRQIADSLADDLPTQLDIGTLLFSYGFLSDARACYERAQALAPTDLRATVNQANLAPDAGEHAQARRLYAELLRRRPDHPVIRRNALISLEYDPEVADVERLAQARAWGAWAVARAGGARPRLGRNGRALAQANYDLKTACLPRQLAWVEGLIK